jgi:hypothetical protein
LISASPCRKVEQDSTVGDLGGAPLLKASDAQTTSLAVGGDGAWHSAAGPCQHLTRSAAKHTNAVDDDQEGVGDHPTVVRLDQGWSWLAMTGGQVYWLLGAGDDYPRLNSRHPRNRGVDWVELGHYLRGEESPLGPEPDIFVKADREFDALQVAGSGWILSDRARKVFESLVPGDVVFTPLLVNGERFWGMRVTRLLPDALDMERSNIAYHSSGSVNRIDIPVWRAWEIPDPVLFELPQRRHVVWASESVARAYRASGCTGITFGPRGRVVQA